MHIHVGCKIIYSCPQATPILFMLRPSDFGNHYMIEEKQEFMLPVSINNYLDGYGNVVWRVVPPEGTFQVEYNALVATSSTPDLIFSGYSQNTD